MMRSVVSDITTILTTVCTEAAEMEDPAGKKKGHEADECSESGTESEPGSQVPVPEVAKPKTRRKPSQRPVVNIESSSTLI
jgi:hypothetical protein